LAVSTESVLAELPEATFCRTTALVAKLRGPAAATWMSSRDQRPRSRWVAVDSWRQLPATWKTGATDRGPYVASGWHVQKIEPQADEAVVFHYPTLRVYAGVWFLIGAALSWAMSRQNARWGLLVATGSLVLAVLLGSPSAVLAINAFWGSVIGCLIPRFGNPATARRHKLVIKRHSTVGRAAVDVAIVCAMLTLVRHAWGQTSSPPGSSAESPVLQVFVPADAKGQPQGEHLHVPLALQRQLLGTAGLGPGPGWILAQATYTGVLEPQADATSQLQLNTITADFELHVFQQSSVIQFPLVAEAVAALKREAFLDGRRFQLQWDATRSTLALPIQQTGRHHLQLNFQTLTTSDSGRARVELPIPQTPQSTLLLSSPQDLQSLQVPSALGAILRSEAAGQLRADLGSCDHLQIQWPTTAAASTPPTLKQLSWLRLDRDEVRYDVQLVPDPTRLLDNSIVLEVDERLQLDVAVSDQPLSLAPATERGVRRLEFDLGSMADDSPAIQLSFVVTGTAGVGHLRLPRCRVLNHQVSHWLAVSADLGLGLHVTPDNATSLATETFAQRWGSGQAPGFAYELPATPGNWACEGQWNVPVPKVDVQEAQVVGLDGTRVIVLATFRIEDTELFQQLVQLPEQFQIESIQRLPTASAPALRWSRDSSSQLMLLFDDPPVDTFQIGIVGYLADPSLPTRRLARIHFPKTSVGRHHVDVFRDSSVFVTGLPAENRAAPPDMALFIRSQLGLARWQGRLDQPDESAWEVTLQPNERQLQARLTNVISREQGTWFHHLEVQLQVTQGVLDSLTFEIPESWTAGLQGNANLRNYAQASQPGMVRVTYWPEPGPLDPASPVRFDGAIPVSAGQPLSVPNIRLLDEGQIQRQLFLPNSMDGQAILWSTGGLQVLEDAEIPPELAQSGATYQAFLLPDGQFHATRLPAKSASGLPVVSLADLHVAWQDDGNYQGLAVFDLRSDGLDQCVLQFPAGLQPLAISLDNMPVRLHSSGDLPAGSGVRQPVALSSHELPQRLCVVFRGSRTSTSLNKLPQVLQTPSLLYSSGAQSEADQPIPVEQTLWTVYQLGDGTLELDNVPATIDQLQQIRLEHFGNVMEQAVALTTDYSPDDLKRWYSVWGRRFFATLRRIQARVSASTDAHDLESAIDRARQRHAGAAARLNVDAVLQQLQANGELSDATDVWLDAIPPAARVHRVAIQNAASELPIRFRASAGYAQPLRVAAALLIASVGLAVQRWPRRPLVVAIHWPVVGGVLAGLAWWLWLEPSLLGWAIVGLSLLLGTLWRLPVALSP
jgi:hypothetical protein